MLEKLTIKNFIIIDYLELDFNKGLNCFTGETGAGKSIIISALGYLCGNRIDRHILRDQNDRCIIEGYFTLNNQVINKLNEEDLAYDDFLVITKIINKDGKTINKVNGQTVTSSILEYIMQDYVDIHGQKDNQYLLNKKNHLKLLDKFLDNQSLISSVNNKYLIYKKYTQEKQVLLEKTYNESEINYLSDCLKELKEANLSIEEETELLEKEKQFKNINRNLEKLGTIIHLFEKDNGLDSLYHQVLNNLKTLVDDEEDLYHKFSNNYEEFGSLFFNLKNQFSKIDRLNHEIDQIQERLFLYNNLKRKYNKSVSGLLDFIKQANQQIENFHNMHEILSSLDQNIHKSYQEYQKEADALHQLRLSEAKVLEEMIIKELADLELTNIQFVINITTIKDSGMGYDDVEFLISLNKGLPLQALEKVASGGENARILLVLKNIFCKLMDIQVMVFDEIDIGVSGKASQAIGLKMSQLAKNTQVFCITHSGVVASYSDYHYKIVKFDEDDKTISKIILLDQDESIKEIAKIQSGEINEESLALARKLKKDSKNKYERY